MSGQIYNYEAHFDWKWHKDADPWAIPTMEDVESGLKADFATAFLAEFAEKLAAAGHWYKMDRVDTVFTRYDSSWEIGLPPHLNIDVEGTTTIFFETDVKDASAHNSPQLWGEILNAIQKVVVWLGAHPYIPALMLLAGYLTVLYVWMANTTTGAINKIGSDLGSMILVMGGLAVTALIVYALFFTRTGGKAASKGYQIGKRAYSSVRRRI